ncbi:MAG: hypothetical protein Q9178_002332 [Gyalolechia marmorata]
MIEEAPVSVRSLRTAVLFSRMDNSTHLSRVSISLFGEILVPYWNVQETDIALQEESDRRGLLDNMSRLQLGGMGIRNGLEKP